MINGATVTLAGYVATEPQLPDHQQQEDPHRVDAGGLDVPLHGPGDR